MEARNLIWFRLSKWRLRTPPIWSALFFLARVSSPVIATVMIIAQTKRCALSVTSTTMAWTAYFVMMTLIVASLAFASGAIQRVHFMQSLYACLEFSL
jgi:hypothetical protein